MTLTIEIGPPETGAVRTGTLWLTKRRRTDEQPWLVLVGTSITADVFNIFTWPLGEQMGGPQTAASMMASDVLALAAEHLADPLPALVQQIEDMMRAGDVEGPDDQC